VAARRQTVRNAQTKKRWHQSRFRHETKSARKAFHSYAAARSRHLSPIVGGARGSSRDRFQQDSSSQHVDQVSSSGAPSWARADQEPPPARAWGAPSWARADQEPPPARAWSPPTPTTAPSEAPSPGETPRDPKQPCDPQTAMKVGARSARDRHRRARGRSRGACGRFGAQLSWEAEVEEVGLYPELGS
jgi:hypothetical protein